MFALREHGDERDYLQLQKRKFDHDQVNNLLIRCINPIQDVLARDYGGEIFLADRLQGQLDEKLSEVGLKYYRERVWWDAISFVCTKDDVEEEIVREKLDWESYKVAQILAGKELWQQILWLPGSLLRKRKFDAIKLEEKGGFRAKEKVLTNPFY
jgi:hypothetical protein